MKQLFPKKTRTLSSKDLGMSSDQEKWLQDLLVGRVVLAVNQSQDGCFLMSDAENNDQLKLIKTISSLYSHFTCK